MRLDHSIRVVALTGGATVPSARFRVRQYVGRLEPHGVELREIPAPFGSYPPHRRVLRPAWGVATLTERAAAALATRRYDLTLLQRELVSTFSTFEGWTQRPRVFDVDDAVWLLPRGGFAHRVAARCDIVIAGNAYVAEYFAKEHRRVTILPTAVDCDRFVPPAAPRTGAVVLGWSGTSSGLRYLVDIAPALAEVLRARPQVRLRIMADVRPEMPELPPAQVEFVRWHPDVEVAAIQTMDIGLMPLPDTPWERGKCSFKMLLYMACGVAVVVSPVGMNVEVLAAGSVGLAARTLDEWKQALAALVDDREMIVRMGTAGRLVVEARYSANVVGPRLAEVLRNVATG